MQRIGISDEKWINLYLHNSNWEGSPKLLGVTDTSLKVRILISKFNTTFSAIITIFTPTNLRNKIYAARLLNTLKIQKCTKSRFKDIFLCLDDKIYTCEILKIKVKEINVK